MASLETNFKHGGGGEAKFDKEAKPLSPAERLALVQKYLTPEGKGNELFAELCLKYFMPIVIRIIGDKYPNSVEDVVQTAAFKATRNLSQFNGDASLNTWLFRIASNETFDFLRRARIRKDISQADSLEEMKSMGEDIVGPSLTDHARESAEILESMLQILDEHHKHILILHYVEGYSFAEIAAMLDMKENTLKVQVFRAKEEMVKYANKKGLRVVKK